MYGQSWLCMKVFVMMLLIQWDNPQSHQFGVKSHQFGVIFTPTCHIEDAFLWLMYSKSMIITISMQGKVLGDYEHSLTKTKQ